MVQNPFQERKEAKDNTANKVKPDVRVLTKPDAKTQNIQRAYLQNELYTILLTHETPEPQTLNPPKPSPELQNP